MKNSICFIILSSVLLSSCATTPLPGASKVKVKKADPPGKCEELGAIDDEKPFTFTSPDINNKRIILINKAIELGGNYVRLDSKSYGVTEATVFKCP